jgi:hypothetical protein
MERNLKMNFIQSPDDCRQFFATLFYTPAISLGYRQFDSYRLKLRIPGQGLEDTGNPKKRYFTMITGTAKHGLSSPADAAWLYHPSRKKL